MTYCYINYQAQASLAESSRKLDLLRLSLELRRQELPPDSGTAAQLKRELASVQSASPVPVTYTSLQPFRGPLEGKATVPASVSRCAAVTGQLEVCWEHDKTRSITFSFFNYMPYMIDIGKVNGMSRSSRRSAWTYEKRTSS